MHNAMEISIRRLLEVANVQTNGCVGALNAKKRVLSEMRAFLAGHELIDLGLILKQA